MDYIDIINLIKDANETIEVRNGELDAKTEELKSVMKKLVETNAELSKVTLMIIMMFRLFSQISLAKTRTKFSKFILLA